MSLRAGEGLAWEFLWTIFYYFFNINVINFKLCKHGVEFMVLNFDAFNKV